MLVIRIAAKKKTAVSLFPEICSVDEYPDYRNGDTPAGGLADLQLPGWIYRNRYPAPGITEYEKEAIGWRLLIRTGSRNFRPEAPQTLELFPSCARHREESGDLWKETEK